MPNSPLINGPVNSPVNEPANPPIASTTREGAATLAPINQLAQDQLARPPQLDQLLRRPDVWRGNSQRFIAGAAVDTGYPELNRMLHDGGWPTGCLIEMCQQYHASEWSILHPAINRMLQGARSGYLALVNPPATPFIRGLQQLNIPTQRMMVVHTKTPQDWIASVVELNRSSACPVVLAWQPNAPINYTQLRKIHLSSLEQPCLSIMFRHHRVQTQNSPARLRLQLDTDTQHMHITCFKQKGQMHNRRVSLPVPESWLPRLPHHALDAEDASDQHNTFLLNEHHGVLRPNFTSRPLKSVVKHDYN